MGNTVAITLLGVLGGIGIFFMISLLLLVYWLSLVTVGDWLWKRRQDKLDTKLLSEIEEFRHDFD